MRSEKVTCNDLRNFKAQTRRFAALTTYDYPTTRLLDEAGVPVLLVGDSLGMVVLGHPDTTHVTMDDMVHHTRACARARPRALLAADLPYRSYESPGEALRNAHRLLEAGAEAVKAEGGRDIAEQVAALTAEQIPFIGHLGMLPQHVLDEGGYRKKGRTDAEVHSLLADADALVEAGACAIVLELLLPDVADRLTQRIPIPTIGIGSGSKCDGQILVIHDLVGAFPWFRPKFVKPRGDAAKLIKEAVTEWMTDL